MPSIHCNPQLLIALQKFRERCLIKQIALSENGSVANTVWSLESANELIKIFVDAPDESDSSFLLKLKRQLSGASQTAVQLFTELAWLYIVASMNLKPATKRKFLAEIAELGNAKVPDGIYDSVLDVGLAKTGTSYNTHRPFQMMFLIRFVHAWLILSKEARATLLDNAWEFRAFVYSIEGGADAAMRHAIIFYVHPEIFEPILSITMKKQIVHGLRVYADSTESLDHSLYSIRERLSSQYGENFMFWSPDVRLEWEPKVIEPVAKARRPGQEQTIGVGEDDTKYLDSDTEALIENPDRRAWLIRGSSGERVPEWLSQAKCALYSEDLFPFAIEPGVPRDEIRQQADNAGVDITASGFNHALGQMWRFVNEVAPGDYIVTVRGQDIFLGIVDSEARSVGARGRQETLRAIDWLNVDRPISRRKVSPEVYSKLKTLLTLSNISSVMKRLDHWIASGFTIDLNDDVDKEPLDSERALLPNSSKELSKSLLVEKSWLNEIVTLLRYKRQLVLYGPPGTGKTYLANEFVEDLIREGGEVEMIQFHPSYTYEDFFEGYRPVSTVAGQVAFEVKHGPLRRIASIAEKAPGKPHFLIIDEINRGNLAKIFGELYFLLEYRERKISLQYSEDEFSLPDNLFIIGTMNTADRSVALVDSAMRRRFYFVEMSPSKAPVKGLLRRWLLEHELPLEAADLLDELNKRIGNVDLAVGPSYLMNMDIGESGCIERIWQYSIMPLLEERHYGQQAEELRQFDLSSLRKRLHRADTPE